ncbi:MarC family protein [Parendozoicomonas sp. Alg238-R29]|uniref:MarC family protein n=1 Tax=Parendozoicomonas sp. Alg238-R29 TaxID=2993446 RepID=UPI00248F26D4|nr:MarC family protein [Parendozoicomonas sp. Alg238-R29]
MPSELLHDFVLLFAVIDPIGSLPIFLTVTRKFTNAKKTSTALKAVTYSALIIFAFLLTGQALLHTIGIRLGAFQIAGGLVLFLYGLKMIFHPELEEQDSGYQEPGHDVAVFPLAVPSLASPGALTAIIILTDNRTHTFQEQAITALLMCTVLILTYMIFRLAPHIYKLLGENGTAVLVRIMGLIVTALAVEICIEGLASLQWLPLPPE